MSRRESYAFIVERDEDGRIIAIVVRACNLESAERSVRVNGNKAARVASAVHEILRDAGIGGRVWTGPKPITLEPVVGAQVELLLSAVKPLRRADRIDRVGDGVALMSREEASYWHAKSHQAGGLPALRLLLTHGDSR